MKKWYLFLPALSLALAASAMAQSVDAPPSTPTDLVANAYSGTAGGIRWSRSTDDRGPVSRYEVTRDGVVLEVRNALSYVDKSLAPGTRYTYGVTAIDSAGQRSGRATIRLTTNGGAPVSELPAPTGLRASVYSSTAAELFWARPATFGLRYEVLRDGMPLVITDGTSYFDDALSGGTSYAYDVIAIDRQGRRSASSRIVLRTFDGHPPTAGPSAPTGLRASVYSGTAAEIFWTRPATFGLRYEVLRDGARLASTDGTSYFDDTLSRGTTYRYDVIAIDRQGRRSASSDVTLETFGRSDPPGGGGDDDPFAEPDPDGASTIARLGYPATIETVDDLVSAAYLAPYVDVDPALLALVRSVGEGVDVTIACPGGGTAEGSTSTFVFDLVLDECIVEGVTLSGGLSRVADFTVFGLGSSQSADVTFDALRIDAGVAGTLELTGTLARSDRTIGDIACGGGATTTRTVEARIDAARIEDASGTTTVSEATWSQTTGVGVQQSGSPASADGPGDPCTALETLTFDGAATLESSRFGSGIATLDKNGDIVRDERGDMASSASARLGAEFGDGSSLAVTLTSDPDDEAQLDIVADGAAVSFTTTYAFEARADVPPILGN